MSLSARRYVKDLQSMPSGKKLTKAQKLILFVLADYHNEERGYAWASLRRIATESLHTVSGTVRVLRALEDGGIIHIVRDPNPAKTRIINRYQFAALDTITTDHRSVGLLTCEPQATDHRSVGLLTCEPKATDHRSVGLLTTGHHIPLKKPLKIILENKERKTRARELPVDNCRESSKSSERFEQFSKAYPHRGGKRLEQAATNALFIKLSTEDQAQAIRSARSYARDLRAQGLMAKNQKNFLLDPAGHEPWREWIEPETRPAAPRQPPSPDPPTRSAAERAPPPNPPSDPIKHRLWCLTYGNPSDHGFEH